MLRPANVFGFGHFWSGSSGGRKMQALLEAGLDGGVAHIPSAETMANEYVYAKDVGRAADLALSVPLPSLPPPQRVFNIGTGMVTPFAAVLETVHALFPNLRVEIEPGEQPKSKEQPLDISRAKQHLGWEPHYALRTAFEDYVAELKKARTD
jgi:nucleoside-diphosphate-sugar epimerase